MGSGLPLLGCLYARWFPYYYRVLYKTEVGIYKWKQECKTGKQEKKKENKNSTKKVIKKKINIFTFFLGRFLGRLVFFYKFPPLMYLPSKTYAKKPETWNHSLGFFSSIRYIASIKKELYSHKYICNLHIYTLLNVQRALEFEGIGRLYKDYLASKNIYLDV